MQYNQRTWRCNERDKYKYVGAPGGAENQGAHNTAIGGERPSRGNTSGSSGCGPSSHAALRLLLHPQSVAFCADSRQMCVRISSET